MENFEKGCCVTVIVIIIFLTGIKLGISIIETATIHHCDIYGMTVIDEKVYNCTIKER